MCRNKRVIESSGNSYRADMNFQTDTIGGMPRIENVRKQKNN